MKRRAFLILAAAIWSSCGGHAGRQSGSAQSEASRPAPVEYTYRVRAVYPHPTDAYTQGLFFDEGLLWEGTGLHGSSIIRKTDLATNRSETLARLPRSEFGEGIARVGDKLYQLTWQSNVCHVYDIGAAGLKKVRDFRYAGEGWGLTTDGAKLYMTDGTATIRTLDPETFRCEKRTTVTCEGVPVAYLNETEWIDGKLWANVYTTDRIVIIDPATGDVEGIVDLAGLLPESERGPETDVLNGIAYDAATKRLFVTGKNWSRIFEIELIAK